MANVIRNSASTLSSQNALATQELSEPRMQFDYENRSAVHTNPYIGLRDFGPFDASERRRAGVPPTRVVVVAQKPHAGAIANVKEGLSARRLNKLHDVFPLTFVGDIHVPPTVVAEEPAAYQRAIDEWFDAAGPYRLEVDLAIVLHADEGAYKGPSPYFSSKAAFMRRGVPTQSIVYRNVSNQRLDKFKSYLAANIHTACYAKVGGVPWVVQAGQGAHPEITVGVSTTAVPDDRGNFRNYVGISTIFRENGAFALWDITEPEQDLEKYEEKLEATITRAINTFEQREGRNVTRIACHVSGRRAGRRETTAVQRALEAFPGRTIDADIVHISEESPLWLFDGTEGGYVPRSGLLTRLTLDGRASLMHTEGLTPGSARRVLTRPLRLTLHGESPADRCDDIHQHLYDLRWMSWRGVRTASGPVSIAYPKKMAYLLEYMHQYADVQAFEFLAQLKNKAWFL